nr:hypothetical protein [Tanacetum cinerariifolium]
MEVFKEILQICLRLLDQEFDKPPSEEEILSFIKELGHTGKIKNITAVVIDNRDAKKQGKIYYPRFTKAIIHHFLSKDKSISMRNRMFMHTANDDCILDTMRFLSKDEDTQVYRALIPTVPNDSKGKTTGGNKGTGTILGVFDVPKDQSENKNESWRESGDNDDSNDDDNDDDSDDGEEEYEDEYVRTPANYKSTNDENEDVDEEEYDRIDEELYKDVNVELKDVKHEEEGKEDVEMTDAGHDDVTQETTYDQVEDDAHVTLTAAHVTQKTKVPIREDKDKDEEPLARSDQGMKRRKTSKDAESSKGSKSKESKLTSSSKGTTRSQPKSSGKSAQVDEPIHIVDDTKVQQNQGQDMGPVFNILKGTCISRVELKYNIEECYKAVTDRLDWNNPKGKKYPFDNSKPLPLVVDRGRQVVPVDYFINNDLEYLRGGSSSRKYTTSITKTKAAKFGSNMVSRHDVYSTKRIIAITKVKFMKWYDYGYLEEIEVRREDHNYTNLKKTNFHSYAVEDLYMGVQSYQKKLKITKPETFRSDISNKIPYTAYKNPQGIIYKDKYKRNRVMRTDKLYKFSDETLTYVRYVLHYIASNLWIDYVSKRK